MEIINLILLVLLIALTGFFVATEFAIIPVRSSRIDQLISEGKKGAVVLKESPAILTNTYLRVN